MKVAVTGASGQLGTVVLRRLAADEAIETIVALDLRPPAVASPKVKFVRADVRDASIGRHFDGCDAVVHLAFVVTAAMPRPQMDAINLGGSRNVFENARAHGVKHVLYASSVAAYGVAHGHPENIVESTPRHDVPDFAYSSNKFGVEAFLDEFERAHPEILVTRIRPSILVGTNIEHAMGDALRRHFLVEIAPVPQSIVWDEDVADLFHLALKKRVGGAFNAVADDPLTTVEMARVAGFRVVRIPTSVALSAVTFAAALGKLGIGKPIDPAWVRAGGVRLGFSAEKAKKELGWSPRCPDARAVIRRFVELAPHAPDVRIALFLRLVDRGAHEFASSDARVHLCLRGAGGGDWTLDVRGGRLSVRAGIPRPPDAVIFLKASHFLELMSGKLDFESAQQTGKVQVEGDPRATTMLGAMVQDFRRKTARKGAHGAASRRLAQWFAHA